MTKIARFCGLFCLVGMVVGIILAMIGSVYPSSTGSTLTNDFVVTNPVMHRLEHLFAAIGYYPALCAGLFGFYAIGAAGRGLFGKILLALTAIGGAFAISGSFIEAIVLQWEAADMMRAFGFGLLLLVLCPLLWGIAALFKRVVPLWLRVVPIILVALFFVLMSFLGRNHETFAVAIVFTAWAFFGYAIYTHAAGQNEADLSFETKT